MFCKNSLPHFLPPQIWEKVPKPQASENAPLDKFFKVKLYI